jgi:predicted nucleic acid-binding protein
LRSAVFDWSGAILRREKRWGLDRKARVARICRPHPSSRCAGCAALRCAALQVPNPPAERDALIAATALVHGMTVVTRNTQDFESTGVRLLDPWQP